MWYKICLFNLIIVTKVHSYKWYDGFDPDNPASATCIPADFLAHYDYFGRKNTTIFGLACLNWLDVNKKLAEGDLEDELGQAFPYWKKDQLFMRQILQNHNYCRHFLVSQSGPWCVAEAAANKFKVAYCFPHCELTESSCVDSLTNINVEFIGRTQSITGSYCAWTVDEMKVTLSNLEYEIKDLLVGDGYQGCLAPKGKVPYCKVRKSGGGIHVTSAEPCFQTCQDYDLDVRGCMERSMLTTILSKGFYSGKQATTVTGKLCKAWKNVDAKYATEAFKNLRTCQCPSHNVARCRLVGLWCYHTTLDWEPCFSFCDSLDMDRASCTQAAETDISDNIYLGKRQHTFDGNPCNKWSKSNKDAVLYGLAGTSNCIGPAHSPRCQTGSNEEMVDCFQDCLQKEDKSEDRLDCISRTNIKFPSPRRSTFNRHHCQRWDQQTPHTHIFRNPHFGVKGLDEVSNFCRNPDNSSSGPWCYTLSKNVVRESCYPQCGFESVSNKAECMHNVEAMLNYAGKKTQSFLGHKCVPWETAMRTVQEASHGVTLAPQHLGFNDWTEAGRFCRNPFFEVQGPFCYVPWFKIPGQQVKKEYCFSKCGEMDVTCLSPEDRVAARFRGNSNSSVDLYDCKSGSLCRNDNSNPLGPFCKVDFRYHSIDFIINSSCFPVCSDLRGINKHTRIKSKHPKTIELLQFSDEELEQFKQKKKPPPESNLVSVLNTISALFLLIYMCLLLLVMCCYMGFYFIYAIIKVKLEEWLALPVEVELPAGSDLMMDMAEHMAEKA